MVIATVHDGGGGVGVGDLDADGGDGGDDAEDARNYWTFSCQKILDFSCQNILDFLMPGILDLLDARVPAKRSGLDKGHQDSSPSSPLLLIHPLTASA